MNRDEIRTTLQQLFREVFDDESIQLTDGLGREGFKSWDSLGHIRLVAAAEEAFNVSFTIEEIEGFTSADKIIDCVAAKR